LIFTEAKGGLDLFIVELSFCVVLVICKPFFLIRFPAFQLHVTFFVAVVAFDHGLAIAVVVFTAFFISGGKSVSSFEGLSFLLSFSVVDHLDCEVVHVISNSSQVLMFYFGKPGDLVLGTVGLVD
jgi:hypothetical protein